MKKEKAPAYDKSELTQEAIAEEMTGRARQWPRLYHAGRQALSKLFADVIVVDDGLATLRNLEGQPHVVAPRHQSNLDTGVMGELYHQAFPAAEGRAVAGEDYFGIPYFVAKEGLFIPGLGFLVRHCGGIKIDRKKAKDDQTEVRHLQACVGYVLGELGQPVNIYPEGTRTPGDQVGEIFGGVAMMAAKSKVPIVPVGIYGTAKQVRREDGRIRPEVFVAVGQPIEASRRLKDVSEKLTTELQTLTDRAKEAFEEAA